MKVSTKHQIVVPSEARRRLGVIPGDRLTVEITDDAIVLRRRAGSAVARIRGIAEGKGWYGPDPATFVRTLRSETEEHARERQALIDRAFAERPQTGRVR
ncbi:MAG TPA: AbrB/MazE/SpoVT family DNA-binding domain-containing protein [Candidatus Sulfomarinibacteraceae bacterium]|nr:AbrB/MazE/SpoVT family DNA-binding domain-containing protein [Candidatus Sulfomarinibacteraceae bacterium]